MPAIAALLLSNMTALGSGNGQVAANLLAVADAAPEDLVWSLARARVPAGLELHGKDRHPGPAPSAPSTAGSTIRLAELVDVFNAGHAEYEARVIDAVFVVRPRRERSAYLDGGAPQGSIHLRGVMTAARRLFLPLDPGLQGSGGIPGSFLGGADVDRGQNVDLNVNGTGLTVLGALNAIARQAPGHAWLVVTTGQNPVHVSRFGFLHYTGVTTETDVSVSR